MVWFLLQLYVDWVLNKSIKRQFEAFSHGFHRVCGGPALVCVCFLGGADISCRPQLYDFYGFCILFLLGIM